MHGPLYFDTPTTHRVVVGGRARVVHARHDWEGTFVRFVVHRTPGEMEAARRSYLPAKVGIVNWYEVYTHNFKGAK